jgi:hypothetical protein
MRSRLDDQLQSQGQGLAKAAYETGYTMAVLLLIVGAAWNVYLFLQSRRLREASRLVPDTQQHDNDYPSVQSEPPPSPIKKQSSSIAAHDSENHAEDATGIGQPGARICRHCGQLIRATARFCESCGRSAEITEGSPEAQIPLK